MNAKIIFSKGGIRFISDIVSVEKYKYVSIDGKYTRIVIRDKNDKHYVYENQEVKFIVIFNKESD